MLDKSKKRRAFLWTLMQVWSLFFITKGSLLSAQELQADVRVISDKIQQSNREIFDDLERSLQLFLNQTQWSQEITHQGENHMKVSCNFVLIIDKMISNEEFSATLSVQASRLVFNSLYQTSIFNYREEGVHFSYLQNESLNYNPNTYTSELLSLMAFYVYMILGVHADSMQKFSGNKFFQQARQVQSVAVVSGSSVWLPASGENNRYWLLDNWISPLYSPVREAYYIYHRKGLDQMHRSLIEGKEYIEKSIDILEEHAKLRSYSIPLQIFMEAKAYEISQVFSVGPKKGRKVDIRKKLDGFYPAKASVWALIR